MTLKLIVAGGGEGTYKNLVGALRSQKPKLDMKIAAVIDVKRQEDLHPEIQRLIDEEGVLYLTEEKVLLGDLSAPEDAAGVIMTPNDSHLRYAKLFAHLGMPTWVEKPVGITLAEADEFLRLAGQYPQIYASEYGTDGKAISLLWVGGTIGVHDPRAGLLVESDDDLIGAHDIMSLLGQPLGIEGRLLEGAGAAGTADHRAWLLGGTRGGMIRDLASHLFGPLYELGLASDVVIDPRVTLGVYESGSERGTYRPLRTPEEGETYAQIIGRFAVAKGCIPFRFQVGKYWPEHDRFLEISFEEGVVTFSYEKPFRTTVSLRHFPREISVETATDFYPAIALLDFANFIEHKSHGHIGRGVAIVRFNEAMRLVGLG